MLLAYSRNHSTCLLWNSTFRSLSRFNSADPYSTCWRVKDTVAVQRITTELSLGRMNVMVLPSITRVQLRIFPGSLACHKPLSLLSGQCSQSVPTSLHGTSELPWAWQKKKAVEGRELQNLREKAPPLHLTCWGLSANWSQSSFYSPYSNSSAPG